MTVRVSGGGRWEVGGGNFHTILAHGTPVVSSVLTIFLGKKKQVIYTFKTFFKIKLFLYNKKET